MKRVLIVLFLVVFTGACAIVDETEYCVKTKFGDVVDENVNDGLVATWFGYYDVECFDMTDQRFPEEEEVEVIDAQTSDPVSLDAELSVIWRYNPETIYDIFLEKRREEQVLREVRDAIRSGARNAINSYTITEVFSDARETVEGDIREAIQNNLGNRGVVINAFLRDIGAPEAIELARVRATEQEQRLQEAQRQFQIDSVDAEAEKLTADADAYRREVEARAYNANPQLLELRGYEALANGIAQACNGVETCILGGNVVDRFLSTTGN